MASCGGQSGRRKLSSHRPRRASEALTGIGFDSMKLRFMRSRNRLWIAARLREVAARPRRRTSSCIGPGIWFAATEMTPSAAERHHGQGEGVVAREDLEARRPVAQDLHDLAEASRGFLHRRRCSGASARRSSVAASMLLPVRPGTL